MAPDMRWELAMAPGNDAETRFTDLAEREDVESLCERPANFEKSHGGGGGLPSGNMVMAVVHANTSTTAYNGAVCRPPFCRTPPSILATGAPLTKTNISP